MVFAILILLRLLCVVTGMPQKSPRTSSVSTQTLASEYERVFARSEWHGGSIQQRV